MKKQLLLIAALIIMSFSSFAQISLMPVSGQGGQLQMWVSSKIVLPSMSGAAWRAQWSFNSSYVPAFSQAWDTVSNTTASSDTVLVSDTIFGMNPGTYHIRIQAQDTSGGPIINGFDFTVTVVPPIVAPQITAGSNTPTTSGGIAYYTYDAGNDSALIDVFVDPYDTLGNPLILVDSFWVTGSGAANYVFTGFPSQYYFSYKFTIRNDVATDTSEKKWIYTSASGGNPTVGMNPDSVHMGINQAMTADTVVGYWSVVTNGTPSTATFRMYTTATGGLPLPDSSVQNLPGQSGITNVSYTWYNVPQNVDRWIEVRLSPGSSVSSRYLVHTPSIPYVLTFEIDTAYAVNGNTARTAVRCTSEVAGSFQVKMTPVNDPGFATPVASPLMSFPAGISTQYVDIVNPSFPSTGTGFVVGDTYLVKAEGFNNDGEVDVSPVYSFIFLPSSTGMTDLQLEKDEGLAICGNVIEWNGTNSVPVEVYSLTVGNKVVSTTLSPGERLDLQGLVRTGLYSVLIMDEKHPTKKRITVL